MKQIRFSIEDIKRSKFYYIRFFLQITCVLILFGVCTSQLMSLNEFKGKFDVFEDLSELYVVRDNTDNDLMNRRFSEENIQAKLLNFYSFLESAHNLNSYTYQKKTIEIKSNKGSNVSAVIDPNQTEKYTILFTNRNFNKIFNLTCIQGTTFDEKTFTYNDGLIPVLLGYNYNGFYNVGDTINNMYVVTGILGESASYIDPGKTSDILYLKDSIIAPLVVNQNSSWETLDTIITSSTLITNNSSSLENISEKAKEIGLYDNLNFISFTQQLENIVNDNMTIIYISLAIQLLILFFCLICTITSLMNYIDSHKREFAIHILCGARDVDLILRLLLQIALILCVSNIIALLLFGLSLSSLSVLLMSILILIIIILFPAIKIKKLNLAEFIRSV